MKKSFLLSLLLVLSCAPEQSAETRRREDVDRAVRASSACRWVYHGYLSNSESEITPLSIDVQITKNPTAVGQKPSFLSLFAQAFLVG